MKTFYVAGVFGIWALFILYWVVDRCIERWIG